MACLQTTNKGTLNGNLFNHLSVARFHLKTLFVYSNREIKGIFQQDPVN